MSILWVLGGLLAGLVAVVVFYLLFKLLVWAELGLSGAFKFDSGYQRLTTLKRLVKKRRGDGHLSISQVTTTDVRNVAPDVLKKRGGNLSALSVEQREQELKAMEDEITTWLLGSSEHFERRRKYDEVIARAQTIIDDNEGKYPEGLRKTVRRIYDEPVSTLASMKAKVDEFFEKLTCDALREHDLGQLSLDANATAAAVVASRKGAERLAADYAVEVKQVYRTLVRAPGSGLSTALKIAEKRAKEFHYEWSAWAGKLGWDSNCESVAFWLAVVRKDLSLPQSLIMCNALGIELQEFNEGIDCIRRGLEGQETASSTGGNGDEYARQVEKACEAAERTFKSLKSVWSVIGGRYESAIEHGLTDYNVRAQPGKSDEAEVRVSFRVSFRHGNKGPKVWLRHMGEDAVLVYDDRDCSFYLSETSTGNPLVKWRCSSSEPKAVSDFFQITVGIERSETEKIITLCGIDDDAKTARVVCDAATNEVKNVDISPLKEESAP